MDIYVIVAANDQPHRSLNKKETVFDDGGPLVFEQNTNSADLESAKQRIKQLNGQQ